MEGFCSFQSIVGTACSYHRRGKSQSTTVVPLGSCSKDVSTHKSSLAFSGIENEKELILARSGLFYIKPNDEKALSICPLHRFELGVGWKRTRTTCRVPNEIASHKKGGKADRGISKEVSKLIYQRTGVLIPVGSGICTTCRKSFESKSAETSKTAKEEENYAGVMVKTITPILNTLAYLEKT